MTDSPLLTAALAYAARGWAVFPCAPRVLPGAGKNGEDLEPKRPLVLRGFHAATCDPAQIRAWWARWPDALIGTPTGLAIGHWVLDVDVHDGKPGLKSLAELEDSNGPLPSTGMVRTVSNGLHLLFTYPRDGRQVVTRTALRPGLDVRGAGGYVIAPPSANEEGAWTWREGANPTDGGVIADPPEWLLKLVCEPQVRQSGAGRPAGTPPPVESGASYFAKVNTKALVRLDAWVPAIFPAAVPYHGGFRVTSRALGRALEEDISLVPSGIRDFGEEIGQTPIDIVLAWGPASTAADAAAWLCQRLGVEPAALGWRSRTDRAPARETPPPASGAPDGPDAERELIGAADPDDPGDRPGDQPPGRGAPPGEGGDSGGGPRGERPAWADRLMYSDKGAIQATVFNVRMILEHVSEWRGVLAWCDFSQRVMALKDPPIAHASRGEWTDAHDTALQYWLAERFRFEPNTEKIAGAVVGVAMAHRYHPVRDYLDKLVWDGRERLSTWLSSLLGASDQASDPALSDQQRTELDQYHAMVGVWWMVQSVARIRDPGCKADTVLILEGDQGIKKSSALRALYSAEFSTDTRIDFSNKDAMLSMAGTWLIELPELEGMNKADARTMKAFISSAEDRFRLPYGHRLVRFPRQSVMAGTTNQSEIFRDLTGNRRYWPVTCGTIDMEGIYAERDQLWAEAQARYAQGERWWPDTPAEHAIVEEQQGDRIAGDVWETRIQSFLAGRLAACKPAQRVQLFVSLDSIMDGGLGFVMKEIKPPDWTRAGIIVHSLGWKSTRPAINGQRVRGYRPGPKVLAQWAETPAQWDEGDDHGPQF